MKSMLFGMLLSFFISSAFAATPVETHGKLSVQNGVMVNKNGVPPQLRGMSFFWDMWGYEKYYTSESVNQLVDHWNVSLVRAAIGTPNQGGESSVARAKLIIDAAVAKGVYVIVDWHSHAIETDAAKAFFQEVSAYVKKLGNPPNVIYEIFNEPIDQTWAEIKAYAEAVVPEIRKNSPENIVVVGTPKYSSSVLAPLSSRVSGTNIVYAFHFYASDANHRNFKNVARTAICAKIPLFATEWGLSQADGGGSLDRTRIQEWVSFLENAKLSWANWSIADKNESSAALTSGTTPAQIGNTSNQTASGSYVRNLISTLNSGNSHADVSAADSLVCIDSELPVQEGGGAVIGTDMWLESENYQSLSGEGSKTEESTASGKAYLGGLKASSQVSYGLTSPQDTIVMLMIMVKNTVDGTVLSVTDGERMVQADAPVTTSRWAVVELPFRAGPNTLLTLEVSDGSGTVDIDYVAWRHPDSTDYVNWSLDSWTASFFSEAAHRETFQIKAQGSFFHIPYQSGATVLEALSLDGKLLQHWYLSSDGGELRVDRSALPRGIVVFRVKNALNQAMVVERAFNW